MRARVRVRLMPAVRASGGLAPDARRLFVHYYFSSTWG